MSTDTVERRSSIGRPSWPIRAITWYQGAFSWRPSPCRFTPTCSNYALEAYQVHGNARATWLTIRRLLRCRPFGPSGWDPVPEADAGGHDGHDHRDCQGGQH